MADADDRYFCLDFEIVFYDVIILHTFRITKEIDLSFQSTSTTLSNILPATSFLQLFSSSIIQSFFLTFDPPIKIWSGNNQICLG